MDKEIELLFSKMRAIHDKTIAQTKEVHKELNVNKETRSAFSTEYENRIAHIEDRVAKLESGVANIERVLKAS